MKNLKFIFSVLFLATVVVSCSYTSLDPDQIIKEEGNSAILISSVTDWQSGDAADECLQAGGCSGFSTKVDEWSENGMDGEYYEENAVITISNSDGITFDWSISEGYAVCKVIVKASTGAVIYTYNDATSDFNLLGTLNYNPKNPESGVANDTKDISHVTFCFKKTDACYRQETAWAKGSRYVTKGNWAMYVPYAGYAKTVNIIAGQTIPVGTATFSAQVNGKVTITINLTGAIFYYDIADKYLDNNLKIQGYNNKPAAVNPAPGLFNFKYAIPAGGTTFEIEVPQFSYYGIHLDVGVPCI
jgi:hypothetical protein